MSADRTADVPGPKTPPQQPGAPVRVATPAPADPADPADPAATPEAFDAGTVLLGRYRIESRLGQGGMGVVYLAEDLLLKQRVALKFITGAFARHPGAVDLLLNEVRVARRVSHPNVCRVHDAGEVDGRLFISMEYVDGENLVTLLKRVGRLTGDRAHAIARQICSGLFAAHEQGVLHRDLKPANVMVDANGDVRITDFGIAALVETANADDRTSGTPAYMAPELFAGAPATVRSDIYALGLVLYELYTGHRAVNAESITVLASRTFERTPPPHEFAPDLDPEVERVILACIDEAPERRPSSAMAVLGGLPGGDPLGEALAAGRTPSPDLIAAAGGTGCVEPKRALWLAAAIAIGIAALLLLEPDVNLIHRVPLPESPAALTERAREHLAAFGQATGPVSSAAGFAVEPEYLRANAGRGAPRSEWDARVERLHGGPLSFWYRQVPRPLLLEPTDVRGRVTWNDPPPALPGLAQVRLDPDGTLRELVAIPATAGALEIALDADSAAPAASAARAAPGAAGDEPWVSLFAAANLDPGAFTPIAPALVPIGFADERAAWTGARKGTPRRPLRVEAAAYAGRPVAFEVVEEQAPRAERASGRPAWWRAFDVALIAAAALMCWHAVRSRRADLRGAWRLALGVFCAVLLFTLLAGDHGGAWAGVGGLLFKGMTHGVAVAALLALYYLAIEPHARRLWPQTIIGWERLLAGRVRDPLVGHDALVGLVVGALLALLIALQAVVPRWLGAIEPTPPFNERSLLALMGPLPALGALLEMGVDMARECFKLFVSLVLARMLLRNRILAGIAVVIAWSAVWVPPSAPEAPLSATIVPLVVTLSFVSVATFALVHHGLLAVVIGFVSFGLFNSFPLTLDLSDWTSATSLLGLALVLGTTVFATTNAMRRSGVLA